MSNATFDSQTLPSSSSQETKEADLFFNNIKDLDLQNEDIFTGEDSFYQITDNDKLLNIPSFIHCRSDFPGVHDFAFKIEENIKITKSMDFAYSKICNILFIKFDVPCIITFHVSNAFPAGSIICATPYFIENKFEKQIVCRCHNHVSLDSKPHKAPTHLLRCDHESANYIQSTEGHHCVYVPYVREVETFTYRFMCTSTCLTGIQKRKFKIQFTLEHNSIVLGCVSLEIKVSACPGRDKKNKELKELLPSKKSNKSKIVKDMSENSKYSEFSNISSNQINNDLNHSDFYFNPDIFYEPLNTPSYSIRKQPINDNSNNESTTPFIEPNINCRYLYQLEEKQLLTRSRLDVSSKNSMFSSWNPLINIETDRILINKKSESDNVNNCIESSILNKDSIKPAIYEKFLNVNNSTGFNMCPMINNKNNKTTAAILERSPICRKNPSGAKRPKYKTEINMTQQVDSALPHFDKELADNYNESPIYTEMRTADCKEMSIPSSIEKSNSERTSGLLDNGFLTVNNTNIEYYTPQINIKPLGEDICIKKTPTKRLHMETSTVKIHQPGLFRQGSFKTKLPNPDNYSEDVTLQPIDQNAQVSPNKKMKNECLDLVVEITKSYNNYMSLVQNEVENFQNEFENFNKNICKYQLQFKKKFQKDIFKLNENLDSLNLLTSSFLNYDDENQVTSSGSRCNDENSLE